MKQTKAPPTKEQLEASKAKWNPLDPKKVEVANLTLSELTRLHNQIAATLDPAFDTRSKLITSVIQEPWGVRFSCLYPSASANFFVTLSTTP